MTGNSTLAGRKGARPVRRKRLLIEIRRNAHAYLFISPFYILMAVFMLFPTLFSLYMSFFDWRGMGARTFVGLENYRLVFQDPDFGTALFNTAYIWIGHLPLLLLVSLVLAAILNSRGLRGRQAFRAVYFLPNLTSTVVAALVFAVIFSTDAGVVNLIITKLGGDRIPFLSSVQWSKILIILLILWRYFGYTMVILLAGLQAVPTELYEVAAIDGASPVQSFLHITLPLMWPILLFLIVISTINSFQIFTEPFVLTEGGPGDSSLTIGLYLYRAAFQYFKFGYASTIAYVVGIAIVVLAYLQWRYMKGIVEW